jgi:hypothetical protein
MTDAGRCYLKVLDVLGSSLVTIGNSRLPHVDYALLSFSKRLL